MKRKCFVLAVLLIAVLPMSAQSDLDSLVLEGRVVNSQGIPLKGAVVSSSQLGVFGATGVDGTFTVKLPMDGDQLTVQKEGLAAFSAKVYTNDSFVIVLNEQSSSKLSKKDYYNKMAGTAQTYFDSGVKFLNGDSGSSPDYKKALACFWRSVNMGHSASAFCLGKMYEEGLGVEQNYENAVHWYKMAPDNAEAQRRLGDLYAEGKGVQQSEYLATRHYSAAVKAGDSLVALPRLKQLEQKQAARNDNDAVLEIVETNAQFPGGDQACFAWLAKEIKYPAKMQELGIQGRVLVSFVVDKDGSIVDATVTKSPHPLLSREAVRVVSAMPKWTPAMQGSKVVRSRFNIPIYFSLGGGNDDKVFEVVETNASFHGGNQALYTWIAQNMKYPKVAMEQGIQGTVVVQFVVDKDGSLTDVKVMRSPDPSLSKEAERLVKAMPKWKPAMQGGKVVRSRFNLPLKFGLN